MLRICGLVCAVCSVVSVVYVPVVVVEVCVFLYVYGVLCVVGCV